MLSINSRLKQIQKELQDTDEVLIMVAIVDEQGRHITCNQQKQGCPELPCDGSNCWVKQKHPNMRNTYVEPDE